MPRECIKDNVKCQMHIYLGIAYVHVLVEPPFAELAYTQLRRSRYGQSLTWKQPLYIDYNNTYCFEWDILHYENFWTIKVNREKEYAIENLSLLGVHYDHQLEEVSDCFEECIFDNHIGYHASMVSNELGEVIMMGGKAGSGKTTLTKAFVDIGYNFVSDDLAIVNKQLICKYFRTSIHIRTFKDVYTHEVNDEHRKFELIPEQPMFPFPLNLKVVFLLREVSNGQRSISIINNTYEKIRAINSLTIGFPSNIFALDVIKQIIRLPFYEIYLSKKENPNEAAKDLERLICAEKV